MSTVNGTTSGSTASSALAASKAGSKGGIAQNFDSFLLLLTTQLKNQSPLEPLDTNQFTQQLVQFASVEQQLRSNDTLNALLTSVKGSSASNAASFIGKQVSADGATTRLTNGQAKWTLDLARAGSATISIRDSKGNEVAKQNKTFSGGPHTLSWDGRTTTGSQAADGDYTISVSAKDATGQPIVVKTEVSGKVDSVDLSVDPPQLVVGSRRIPLSAVKSLGTAAN